MTTTLFAQTPDNIYGDGSSSIKLTSIDEAHDFVSDKLQKTAEKVDGLFGSAEEKPSLSMKVTLKNSWNKHDGYTLKPRISGRVKLPALRNRLHLFFGIDGDKGVIGIDDSHELETEYQNNLIPDKQTLYEGRKKTATLHDARKENASLGVEWLLPDIKKWHPRVSLELGVIDLYTKFKSTRLWEYENDVSINNDFLYSYGLKNKHYIRNNINVLHKARGQKETNNQLRLEYRNNDDDEGWSWGNSFARRHRTGNDTWYNYGLYVGGYIKDNTISVNNFGPFAGMRQNIYRDWLYFQPKITYFNDEELNRDHHIGLHLDVEANF